MKTAAQQLVHDRTYLDEIIEDLDAGHLKAAERRATLRSVWLDADGRRRTTWLRDVEDGNDRVTVVVRRVRGNPNVGEWPAVVGLLEDWLARLDGVPPTVRVVGSQCTPKRWIDLYGRVEWDDRHRVRVVTTFGDFVHAARTSA